MITPVITKSIPPISAESIALRDYMKTKVKEGDIVTMEMLSGVAGRDLTKHKSTIYASIRALEKENIVYYKVRKVGWQRTDLNSADVVDGEIGVTKQVNRKVRRSLRRLASVRFEALTNDDKMRHSVVSSQIGVISLFSSSDTRDKVHAATITNGKKLETEKLLGLFSK